jgi:hypothetical protein
MSIPVYTLGIVRGGLEACEPPPPPPPPQPPTPPTPPDPFIKPRFEPNCDPEKVVRINCDFGDTVYKDMVSKRYGIDMCCKEDLEKMWIKYEKLKIDLITQGPDIENQIDDE